MNDWLKRLALDSAWDVRPVPRTDQCPDESVYWRFLDDEASIAETVCEHLQSCRYCRSQLRAVARALTQTAALSSSELAVVRRPVTHNVGLPRLVYDLTGLKGLLSSPFDVVPAYRAGEQGESVTLKEEHPELVFQIELARDPSKRHVGLHFELIDDRGRGSVEAQLWQGSRLLRSFSAALGARVSLAKWPPGEYRLKIEREGRACYEAHVVIE